MNLDYKFENWMDEGKIQEMEYFDYWNDEEKERDKDWYILDGNYEKLENHIHNSGLVRQLQEIVCFSKNRKIPLGGKGIDLAAGNLWAENFLLKMGSVEHIYCLEYSKHRLEKIGPKVLQHFRVPQEKVTLIRGSFYDIKLDDGSLDFVFLSQAFHHADYPVKLLKEIKRVLKPKGIVIIIGEHLRRFQIRFLLKHSAKFLISRIIPEKIQRRLFGRTFHEDSIIPRFGDPILGDHIYKSNQYRAIFRFSSFKFKRFCDSQKKIVGYLLYL